MIKCKACGSESLTFSEKCDYCGARLKPSDDEITRLINCARTLEEDYRFSRSLEIWQYLARCENPVGEREMGKILERGLLVPKNADEAERLYLSAAKKLDAEAMLRLSQIITARDERRATFWLWCSAYLGFEGAYYGAARSFCKEKWTKFADFYDTLSANRKNKAAAKLVIHRLISEGGEDNLAYAKWYKRHCRVWLFGSGEARRALRKTKPKEPPEPTLDNPKRLIRSLQSEAISQGLGALSILLTERLSEYGEGEELSRLGKMLAEASEEERRALKISRKEAEERAVSLLEAAAEFGCSDAASYLGGLCERGEILEKDETLAATYYAKAASLGEREAYFKLGKLYLHAAPPTRNISSALRAFDEGAKAGDADCRAMAGELRERREELYARAENLRTQIPKEAFKLYSNATEMGYLPALLRLGECYEYGIGTAKSRHGAFNSYRECIEKQHYPAALGLGRCYAHGIGVNRNFDEAVKYLELAKRQGSKDADELLLWLYENKKRHMTRQLYSTAARLLYRKKYAAAHRLLTLAAELGCSEAALTLGCLFEFGLGTMPRRDEAIRLYGLAGKIPRAKKIKQKILSLYKSV